MMKWHRAGSRNRRTRQQKGGKRKIGRNRKKDNPSRIGEDVWGIDKLFNMCSLFQNNGAQQLASEATIFIVLEDVNDEIPLFTEREQERVLEGEPPGTVVTRANAIDKDGTFPNNQVFNLDSKSVVLIAD